MTTLFTSLPQAVSESSTPKNGKASPDPNSTTVTDSEPGCCAPHLACPLCHLHIWFNPDLCCKLDVWLHYEDAVACTSPYFPCDLQWIMPSPSPSPKSRCRRRCSPHPSHSTHLTISSLCMMGTQVWTRSCSNCSFLKCFKTKMVMGKHMDMWTCTINYIVVMVCACFLPSLSLSLHKTDCLHLSYAIPCDRVDSLLWCMPLEDDK